jgi:hypothetical protein
MIPIALWMGMFSSEFIFLNCLLLWDGKLVIALKRLGHMVTRDVVSKVISSVQVKMSHIKTNRGLILFTNLTLFFWKSMWDSIQSSTRGVTM